MPQAAPESPAPPSKPNKGVFHPSCSPRRIALVAANRNKGNRQRSAGGRVRGTDDRRLAHPATHSHARPRGCAVRPVAMGAADRRRGPFRRKNSKRVGRLRGRSWPSRYDHSPGRSPGRGDATAELLRRRICSFIRRSTEGQLLVTLEATGDATGSRGHPTRSGGCAGQGSPWARRTLCWAHPDASRQLAEGGPRMELQSSLPPIGGGWGDRLSRGRAWRASLLRGGHRRPHARSVSGRLNRREERFRDEKGLAFEASECGRRSKTGSALRAGFVADGAALLVAFPLATASPFARRRRRARDHGARSSRCWKNRRLASTPQLSFGLIRGQALGTLYLQGARSRFAASDSGRRSPDAGQSLDRWTRRRTFYPLWAREPALTACSAGRHRCSSHI